MRDSTVQEWQHSYWPLLRLLCDGQMLVPNSER